MANVDWERVETIVDEVLKLPEEDWFEFIEEECDASQEVKTEATRLLHSIINSEGWLEDVEAYEKELSNITFGQSPSSSLVGTEVGSYRISEVIARGGMGTVYRGERADGEFEHTVAIKIIRMGMDTPENIRLFNRERNILAGLNHPGIAKLLDGGVMEHDAPYLIMEYVDGIPIDQYCSEKKLSISERLNLFKAVCRAIQYAHNNLIIHRDLKPDNILITEQGQVKILDFGIAKLLDTEVDSEENKTISRARILTPEYAAPEQLSGQNVTLRTDIYALGILLYKLLTDTHPFDFKDKHISEIEHIIKEKNPLKPSSRKGIGKELQGDLEAIILKSMRKEESARYNSVGELVEDLQRYEDDLPVMAHKGRSTYQMRKFLKRNKQPIVAFVIFLMSIAGLTGYYTYQLAQERNQAQLEADKAEQVTAFLVDLFGRSNPFIEEQDGGTDVTVGAILEFGTEKIDKELADQPAVRAELKTVLGKVYDALNEYEQAEDLLTEAVHIRRNSDRAAYAETANSIAKLAYLYQEQDKFDRAEELLEESISYYRQSKQGLANHDAIAAISLLGNLTWYNKGDYEKADSLLHKASELRKSIHESDHAHLATNYNDLATLYHSQGEYKTAEQYYRQSIDIYSNLFEEHSNLAVIMGNFSALLKERGDYAEAEIFQRRSLNMHKKLTGEENRDVALGTGNLGHILLEQHQLNEADSLLSYSLDLFNKIFDPPHTYISRTKLVLGKLYTEQNDYQKAEKVLLETKNEYEQLFPEGHPRRSDPLVGLGNLYFLQQKTSKAEPLLKEALDIRKKGYGENNWKTAHAMSLLGMIFVQSKKFDQAESLLLNSFEILDEERTKSDKYRIQNLEYIIQLYDEWEKPMEKKKFQQFLATD